MHPEITITEYPVAFLCGCKIVAIGNACEEFIHQDLAVFAVHEFFVSLILIKYMVRAYSKRTASPGFAIKLTQFHICAVLTATLFFLRS